jgi:spore coat protein A
LQHLLPVDQTLHWANPPGPIDSTTTNSGPYTGPVPIVTHVHGAHVDPHSDGYPEAWWLPAGLGAAGSGYVTKGTLFDDQTGTNTGNLGYADYLYRQDQPATTLWYHDHTLGMTRLNVYAGPAGFWLIRGGSYDSATDGVLGVAATLPGPAPTTETVLQLNVPGSPQRNAIREIPIVIQDRSFDLVTDAGGNPIEAKLFYPSTRAFFDGFAGPYIPDAVTGTPNNSDIAPTWNPEAFFNVMVVNGVSWPSLEVAPALYRFRLLNGCNSRFLNLALKKGGSGKHDIPFYQIGAEQGFLPQVVRVETGFATPLLGNGIDTNPKYPDCVRKNGKAVKNCANSIPAPDPQQALLLGLAERADVIVDFRGLTDGDIVRMINTAPDAPFGGFPDVPADPATSGQVMQFVINSALLQASDTTTTPPTNLVLASEPTLDPVTGPLRKVSLNEEESATVCVDATNVVIPGETPPCATGVPAAPKAALLGTVNAAGTAGIPLKWTATGVGVSKTVTVPAENVTVWVTENPALDAIEEWDIYNFTVDAHPIHLHLVRFEVVSRRLIGAAVPLPGVGIQQWETGFKDTVTAYPGEITRVKAKFDIGGLYVWHCHIVEHEDNEMMRPYFVGP